MVGKGDFYKINTGYSKTMLSRFLFEMESADIICNELYLKLISNNLDTIFLDTLYATFDHVTENNLLMFPKVTGYLDQQVKAQVAS